MSLLAVALWFAASVAMAALARRLGLLPSFEALAQCGAASAKLMARSGVSDWAKERAMRIMAWRLFSRAMRTTGLLLLVGAPFLVLVAADRLWSLGLWTALKDWRTNALLLAAGGVWFTTRRISGRAGERLLQQVAMGVPAVAELAFDIERRSYGRAAAAAPDDGAPIFVVGLARAGTTVLTQLLHETGGLASPTYRDLPFPLAPNGWAKMSAGTERNLAAVERPHGDGVLHSLDSPEAIEELFWLVHEGERYRAPGMLVPTAAAPETVAAFRDYVSLVRLRYGEARYLSKNNNNLLRLPALLQAFPDAVILHPFREPLQHAASLLNQHRRARALAAEDPFGARFMHWMGHHEFGSDVRPFAFPGAPLDQDPETIDYWLAAWISVHRWLLEQPITVRTRQLFLDYDALCADGAGGAPALTLRLGLNSSFPGEKLRPATRHAPQGVDEALLETATAVHESLRRRSLNPPAERSSVQQILSA